MRQWKVAGLVALACLVIGCKTPTKAGVTLDVPLFGHLEVSADPLKAADVETEGVREAVGLTSSPAAEAPADPAK